MSSLEVLVMTLAFVSICALLLRFIWDDKLWSQRSFESEKSPSEVDNSTKLEKQEVSASVSNVVRSSSVLILEGCRVFRDRRENALILEATFGLPKPIGVAIGQVVDLANRDFVQSWYRNTSPDGDFLEDARLLMLDIVGGCANRLCKLNFAHFLVREVAPILRRNVSCFQEKRKIAAELNPELFLNGALPTAELYTQRERCLFKAGLLLHPGATDGAAHIQQKVQGVLELVLSAQDRHCAALKHLIREIIVRSIILPLLESLHPYCLNSGIVSVSKSEKSDDGRAVETLKAGASAFLGDSDASTIDDEPASMLHGHIDHLEEEYFTNMQETKDSPVDQGLVWEITSLRVLKAELALDYSDPADPSPYMAYVLEVRARRDGEVLVWQERTRYSRLKRLHELLNSKYPYMTAKFPSSRGWKKYILGLPEFDKSFVDSRTRQLNEYVVDLMSDPYARTSPLLRKFFGAGMPKKGSVEKEETSVGLDTKSEVYILESSQLSPGDLGEVYALVEAIFLLDQGRFSFFRSNIISFVRIILKTAFKGSILQKLTRISENHVQTLTDVFNAVRDGTWPDGKLAPPPSFPGLEVQERVRHDALLFLQNALPKQVVSLIGASHRDLVAETCHEMIQYHALSKSILLEIADALIRKLFPEIN